MRLVPPWTETPWHDVVAAARGGKGRGTTAQKTSEERRAERQGGIKNDVAHPGVGVRARVARGRTDEQDRHRERTPSGREQRHLDVEKTSASRSAK